MHLSSPVQKPRAALHTIGCRLNQTETALLADRLRRDGYELVEFGQPTDLLVLNTCSVTERAESDCRYAVRRTLGQSPNAFVAVTGCYAQTGADTLRRIAGIDLIVGTQFKMQLPDYLPPPAALRKPSSPLLMHTRSIDRTEFELPGTGEYETTRAPLKIQDGCDFMCSFCIIPFARGHERSRSVPDILREAEALVNRGHRELVLTGVNIGRFEADGCTLLDLIQDLETIPDLDRIRISSIEPTTIPDQLLDYMAASRKLCHYLHVPLQSGDDAVLQSMNRRYSSGEYRALIEKTMARIPNLGLGTDVMVGFPGETEDQFANTLSLVTELPFDYLHVFTFSKRPGTAAARMKQTTLSRTIAARRDALVALSRSKRLAAYQEYIGRTVRVLFEAPEGEGQYTGLTDNFIRVGVSSQDDLRNQVRDVVVTGVMDGLAIGHLDQHADNLGDVAHRQTRSWQPVAP